MKALVLTCDKYRALTEHMIFQYERLWPDHPFTFRIPYQSIAGTNLRARQYVLTDVAIKPTVLTLLEGFSDDDWVYWAIDDKYPMALALSEVKQVSAWIERVPTIPADGILFCRCRALLGAGRLLEDRFVDEQGRTYLRRKGYDQIWIHQFVRAKVIRHLFRSFPDHIPTAKAMDQFIGRITLPPTHRLFVTEKNLAVFGESTSRGRLTVNCHHSLVEHHLPLPVQIGEPDGQVIVMGTMDGSLLSDGSSGLAT